MAEDEADGNKEAREQEEEEETDEADAVDHRTRIEDTTGETAEHPQTRRCTYRRRTGD